MLIMTGKWPPPPLLQVSAMCLEALGAASPHGLHAGSCRQMPNRGSKPRMVTLAWPARAALLLAAWAAPLAGAASGGVAKAPVRTIVVDVGKGGAPLDRFFDFSVGSDYPGTLIRSDSQTQLKTAVDELGFRYIRFHAIFHDVLGTVKADAKTVSYDWTNIDRLYDQLLARRIKPFVELGFTPQALKTSDNKIFWWNGNTSHPKPDAWRALVDAFVRHLE